MKTILIFSILLVQNYAEEIAVLKTEDDLDTLVLLHAVFRHGNRTTDVSEFYPTDPYINEKFFPFGNGQLTKFGKTREYLIGTALREKYNKFLGPYYYPDIGDFWSTGFNRTKMSLELVLAGLFPPSFKEIWNLDLNWQPIPYNYKEFTEDKILAGIYCPHYRDLYNEYVVSPKYQKEFNKHQTVVKYLSENSGKSITTFQQILGLYVTLSIEKEWGFELPQWTSTVFPNTLSEIGSKEYLAQSATTPLKQMAAGYLFRKIIKDTQDKISNIGKENGRKIYLYSAHEFNVAQSLIFLNAFTKPHVPNYGAYVLVEVHYINKVYGFKFFYQSYTKAEPEPLKMPGCPTFCPLDKFIKLVEEFLPSDDLCNQKLS